eukprot:CAMPEP_0174977646 /NCGR_PEP_ID=MMETSP0004_2-20121128/13725_1 /TAXON_ID=420556 /ORGANISM="Ochromonas sp., Strain CCMP1393" /LENGTH=315 /DNA_ID=CAMNT_0016228853 /DNA_START=56 /DNA_END=1003 /DNA_ORIENTATION=-
MLFSIYSRLVVLTLVLILYRVRCLLQPPKVAWTVPAALRMSSEAIDPLDQIKQSNITPKPPRAANDSSISASLSNSYLPRSMESVEKDIQEYEARLLETVPSTLYRTYSELCRLSIQKVSFVALVLHVMMLIPFLRYVKLVLGQSVVPYIYLAPLVYSLPYIGLWLWENNIIESDFANNKLTRLIEIQQEAGNDLMQQEESRMMETLMNSAEEEDATLKMLATCRLITKLDVEKTAEEVLAIKRSRGASRKSSLSTTDTRLDVSEVDMYSRGRNSISAAVDILLTESEQRGEPEEQLLEKLKQLQKDLDQNDTSE